MAQRKHRSHLILIIDDDQDLSEMHKIILESSGYQVKLAHSGVEAMQILQHIRPDLVLLDYHLSDMTGNFFLQRLRVRNPNFEKYVPIVFFTSSDATPEISSRFIQKSRDIDLLLKKVREYIVST